MSLVHWDERHKLLWNHPVVTGNGARPAERNLASRRLTPRALDCAPASAYGARAASGDLWPRPPHSRRFPLRLLALRQATAGPAPPPPPHPPVAASVFKSLRRRGLQQRSCRLFCSASSGSPAAWCASWAVTRDPWPCRAPTPTW